MYLNHISGKVTHDQLYTVHGKITGLLETLFHVVHCDYEDIPFRVTSLAGDIDVVLMK